MRTIVTAFFAFTVLVLSGCSLCAPVPYVVQRRSAGHGFCKATLMVRGASSFESISYFGHCFYLKRDLGRCDSLSVSPSGHLAAWQDGPSGRLRVFSPSWTEPRWLNERFEGLVREFQWREAHGELTVYFSGSATPKAFRLPAPN